VYIVTVSFMIYRCSDKYVANLLKINSVLIVSSTVAVIEVWKEAVKRSITCDVMIIVGTLHYLTWSFLNEDVRFHCQLSTEHLLGYFCWRINCAIAFDAIQVTHGEKEAMVTAANSWI
jgi:hypothetical protein